MNGTHNVSHAVVEAGLVTGLSFLMASAAPIVSLLSAIWVLLRIWQEPTTQKFAAWIKGKLNGPKP